MKIIIPMSGEGKRFVDAGYNLPKPLIKVDGKPIIEYIVEQFTGVNEFIFICNKTHLNNTNMKKIILQIVPDAQIISIKEHKKGPVFAVKQAFDLIGENEEVMISYCDFGAIWDFEELKRKIKEINIDGAVPSYIGFHPHLLHKKLYGALLVDKNNFVTEYKEKHCFTENPMDCYQSAGSYYFRTGKQLKKYTQDLIEKNININGELYISMIYYFFLENNLKIYVPKIKYFMQWGTPEDLEEYEFWSRTIHKEFNVKKKDTDIPPHRTIKIPWKIDSIEYKKSYDYWKNYFKEKWQM